MKSESSIRVEDSGRQVLVVKNLIGGQWVQASGDETFDVTNPANGEIVGRAQKSSLEDTKHVIDSADDCRENPNWVKNPKARAIALYKLADLMESERDSLGRLITLECGEPLREAKAEIDNSADTLRYNAGLARNIRGESFSVSESSFSIIVREPVGVVGHIVPWNRPITLLFRGLATSLAAGNICIVKPASYTPLATARIIELATKIPEMPPGVISYITGPGATVGAAIVSSPKVDMISFTGDANTGKEIVKLSATNVKKLSLELGGKCPDVVFADADPEKAVAGALSGAFTHSGQICFAATRLLVQRQIHEKFVTTLKQKAQSMRVGNGLDETTQLGPIISSSQMKSVLNYVEEGKTEGTLVTGGTRLTTGDLSRGNFVSPTVFDNVPSKARIAQEEIFGPVVVVIPFDNEEQAVSVANDSAYGLAAAVWTRDIKTAFKFARKVKAGTVWVNSYGKAFPEAEFGGYKQSGIGRERGFEGLHEYTQLKHVYFEF